MLFIIWKIRYTGRKVGPIIRLSATWDEEHVNGYGSHCRIYRDLYHLA